MDDDTEHEHPSAGSDAERSRTGARSGVEHLRRLAVGTRSGFMRYSKHLLASVMGEVGPARSGVAPGVERLLDGPLGAAHVGHATILLRIGGCTVLTDPVFSQRIGMTLGGTTFGLTRLRAPALDVNDLPPIDVVLISHAHFDHLDRPSLARLSAGPARGATVITAMNTRRLIPQGFAGVVEVAWGETISAGALGIRAIKPQHWGARAALDHHRRYNAYVLEAESDSGVQRVFFAGDTGDTHAFDRVGPVNLSIFGIGAYDPWEQAHATPEQVWRMFLRQSADHQLARLLPMHHSTFELGREPIDEPLRRLRIAAGDRAHRLVASAPGDVWVLDAGAEP